MKVKQFKETPSYPADLTYDLLLAVPEEERESFVQQFTSLRFVREHLVAYLTEELEREIKASEDADNYSLPSWSEKQADSIGYRRAYRKIIKTLGGEELKKLAQSDDS